MSLGWTTLKFKKFKKLKDICIYSTVIILLGKEFVVLSRVHRTLGDAVDFVYSCSVSRCIDGLVMV
jgi:hypothetical protein